MWNSIVSVPVHCHSSTLITRFRLIHFVFIFRANKDRWNKLPPPPHNLTAMKGSVKIAANRDFVDFALHNHKAKDLLEWVKKVGVPDECFFATLNHNPSLRVRGAYLGTVMPKI